MSDRGVHRSERRRRGPPIRASRAEQLRATAAASTARMIHSTSRLELIPCQCMTQAIGTVWFHRGPLDLIIDEENVSLQISSPLSDSNDMSRVDPVLDDSEK